MKRYLILYLYFLRFSFSKAMEFRVDFSFRILMDLIYYLVNILFFKVIYLHTPLLAGWTEDQMMIFVASYLLVDAINMTIFSTNMWWLPMYINRGELDYYLIRPVSPLFFLSLREFSANSFLNLVIASGFFVYSLVQYNQPYTIGDLILLVILLLNGAVLYYCTQLLMIIPVFWTQSARGFVDLFYSVGLAMERPHRIYKGWLKYLFSVILPFALIASFPAQLFIDRFNWETFLHLMIVTLFFWLLVKVMWKKGLENYASASS
jgi:ABC-2 type transport system permease protein